MPPIDFTASIHEPLLLRAGANAARTQQRRPMPIAEPHSIDGTIATLPVVEINAGRPVRDGPVHGAAMSPPTKPIANAPPNPLPPTWLSLVCQLLGKLRSNAPN